ncbi:Shikimate O-hydroxycinnamoyltransferase [Citrus sinensis]|uniref:Shikimate O-hydroxycinnamoyltransferase n=1 Tax=Citrus sinensis TaxID=2711 RepID=A0ACB8JA50_CITSI|nr:Shikimate O-hydroxycinnamoyltransferase [Citrus sinensis]
MTGGFSISNLPFIDRTILAVGVPTSPKFHHIEFDPAYSINAPTQNPKLQSNPEPVSSSILNLSVDQINILKAKSNKDHGPTTIKFTRFEILAAHIWRCLCKARGLSNDQVSDIQLEPLNITAERIHNALTRMDDEYMKSALAYLKQQPDVTVLKRDSQMFKCPNLNISNLLHMPIYDADFGWGRPIFFRPVTVSDGLTYILPTPSNDGSLYLLINLETPHIQLFKKLFYEI